MVSMICVQDCGILIKDTNACTNRDLWLVLCLRGSHGGDTRRKKPIKNVAKKR